MQKNDNEHVSVMLGETIDVLQPQNGGLFVDATLGLGGHTEAILRASPETRVVGIDQDYEALEKAKARLAGFGDRFRAVKANFSEISSIAGDLRPMGIIADLGVSSLQLDSESRGFSFRFDAPLDMRMDTASDAETAADLLSRLPENEIADLIYLYGEEKASRRIARRIVEKREAGNPVKTTQELADLVRRAIKVPPKDIHPATRTFQALRIAVNKEIEILDKFVTDSVKLLDTNGILAIITFHSLEDRSIKHAFQKLSGKCFCPPRIPQCRCGATKKIEILTKKPLQPSESEKSGNPRSRSAKLRACRKLIV